MGLEVGSVAAHLGATVDDDAFDRFDRRYEQAETRARRGIIARLRGDADLQDFDRYDHELDAAKRASAGGVTTELRGDFDGKGFRDYEQAGRRVDRTNDDLVRGSGRLRGAFGSLFIGGAGVGALAVGFGAAAVGAGKLVTAFEEAEVVGRRTANVIETTGGVAGVTEAEVAKLAETISLKTGIDDEAIQSGENLLLTFTNVRNEAGKGNDVFNQATKIMVDMSAALGTDASGSAIQLGKALNDPVKGITALTRVGVSFTEQQKEQIKTLAESGKRTEAQKIILAELNKEFGGAAEASATMSGKLSTAFGNLAEDLGGELAPAFNEGGEAVLGFVDEMRAGEGAGGKFRDVLGKVAGGARDVFGAVTEGVGGAISFLAGNRDVQEWAGNARSALGALIDGARDVGQYVAKTFRDVGPDIRTIAEALLKFGRVVADVAYAVTKRALPGIVTAFKGVADIIRGTVKVIAAILRGDFGEAWDGAKQVAQGALKLIGGVIRAGTAPIRTAISGIWTGLRGGARAAWDGTVDITRKGLDFLLGGVTSVNSAIESVIRVGSHLPVVGSKFAGLADDIKRGREQIDKYREALRDTDREQDRARESTVNWTGSIKALEKKYPDIRRANEDYRKALRDARREQDSANESMRDAKPASDRARTGVGLLGRAVDTARRAFDTAGRSIAGGYNDLAQQFSVKQVTYRAAQGQPPAGQGGGPTRRAIGGIPNPGSGAGDDHLLLDPRGIPVALMSGTEGILNTPQMGIVDTALRVASAVGALPFNGLDALWGAGMKHYAGGGAIVPVPGFPGERANAAILDEIAAVKRAWPSLILTDAFGPGHSSPGHTVTGTAADFSGPDRAMDAAVAALVKQGYLVGYDGRFGSQRWPGHGPSYVTPNFHFHVEFGSGAGGLGGLGAGASVPRIPGVTIQGPASPVRSMLQRAVSSLRNAGQNRLESLVGDSLALPVGGGGTGAGKAAKGLLMRLWRSVGGAGNAANLAAAVALAESGGDPNASNVNADGSIDRGYWQINSVHGALSTFDPTGNANAAKIISSNGRNWTPWVAFMRGLHRKFLNLGGRLPRFAGGGGLSGATMDALRAITGAPLGRKKPKPLTAVGKVYKQTAGLRELQTDRNTRFETLKTRADDLQRRYSTTERRYDLSVEELVTEDGKIDEAALGQRSNELGELLKLRNRILEALQDAREVANNTVKTYSTIIKRILDSLRGAKKKDRGGLRALLRDYQGRRTEWRATRKDFDLDLIPNAKLDLQELWNERAGLRAEAQSQLPDTSDTSSGGDAGDGTPFTSDPPPDPLPATDTTTTPAEPAAPDPVAVAAAAIAAVEAFQAARASLFGQYGSNFISGYGLDAVGIAAGPRYFGAGGANTLDVLRAAGGGESAAPDRGVPPLVMNFEGPPPDPHTWAHMAAWELANA